MVEAYCGHMDFRDGVSKGDLEKGGSMKVLLMAICKIHKSDLDTILQEREIYKFFITSELLESSVSLWPAIHPDFRVAKMHVPLMA